MKIYLAETDAHSDAVWIDDLAEMPATTPAIRRRGLRNWQKFMLCYTLIMAGGFLLLYDIDGLLTALVGLAIWLATALIILTCAGRKGRL